ncbi:hypothetical protein CSW25_04935 [Thermus scotoductus]|uniref:Lipoprotein n=1 Tax=Thermus scotoductus TaxID=37636 RepID=A0A430RFB0_THESC|nr:hypothetical protein [Thermus scotoductus]AYJ74825.1 hypothetical protein phiMa_42 [Thermus phage phiMa]RTG97850.1 hypothetical protein CSW49_02105 [Thermus scotoductus]RTH06366.1 hypothetical protein CSW45_01875 [Thermus scotoductus]RTH11931.1 hypothetical protein CSW46_03345 [Thermus scotoductus]RTH13003.1 hypothetical protein CSW44_02855 [Thermus scotoductus]
MRVILLGLALLLAGCFQDPIAQVKRLLGQHVSPGAAEEEAYRMACAFAFTQSETMQEKLRQIVGAGGILPEVITPPKLARFVEQSGGDSKAWLLGVYQDLEAVYQAQNKACEVLRRQWRFFQEGPGLWLAGVEVEVKEPLAGGIPQKVFAPCYEVRLDWGTVEEQTPGTCLWYWMAKLESFKDSP